MFRGKIAATFIFGAAVPLLLAVLAVPRLNEGIGLERARTDYEAVVGEDALPAGRYADNAAFLSDVLPNDGDALIERAEMMAPSSGGRQHALSGARDLVIEGLLHSPANPRGWVLLCQIDMDIDPGAATRCMDTAFFVAPFDWFVAPKRALIATSLWPKLDSDLRQAVARRLRLMWVSDEWPDHRVKQSLFDVYQTPNGPGLLTSAFDSDKETLREVNRWLLRTEIDGPAR